MNTFEIIMRVAVFVGVATFFWSVSASLETIAKELRRRNDWRQENSGE